MVCVFLWKGELFFPLRNVKCKDYISCQFVELTAKANLHTKNEVTFIVDKKKTQGKAITKFSPDVFKRPTFKGCNDTVSDN